MARRGNWRVSTSKGTAMGSSLAAMAMSAFAMGTGAPGSTAQAAIPPQEAGDTVRAYAIPGGSMKDALSAFADANGYHLLYDTRLTRAMKTRGLTGRYSPEQGLGRLLSGTGLSYRFVRKGTAVSIILAQAATGTQSDAAPVALPTVNVEGAGGGLGGRFTGYAPNLEKPAAAAKTNIPIIQTPYSIQVVPREVLDDQQDISVRDSVVSNVSSVSSGYQFYDEFIVRGFNIGSNTFRNSLKQSSISNLETANLQSIEVVKGPAAMLYGRIEPGGLINLVTKRPLLVPYTSVQEQFGSFGFTRTTVDTTGPLTPDNSLAYRFNFAFLDTNTFRDFGARRNLFVAPTVSYQPIEQFRLNIDGEYQNTSWVEDFGDLGIPAIGRRPANIPINRYLSDPAITLAHPNRQERSFIGYDATFDIDENWRLVNRFGFTNVNYSQATQFGTAFDEVTGELQRALWFMPHDGANRRTLAANLDLLGKFATGPLNHSVLVGTDFFEHTEVFTGLCCDDAFVKPINIFRPIYDGTGIGPFTNNFFSHDVDKWKGVYAQDQISMLDDSVHILVGGRYDWVITGHGFSDISRLAAESGFANISNNAFSPRLGAVVQPMPWLSFYGSYSKSFGTNNGFPAPGEPAFPPQEGVQFEGGAKAELLGGRLIATMAYYDITKTNILVPIPFSRFFSPVGEAESKGVEFDIAGRIDENWSLIGNYSHTNARVTNDRTEDGGVGNTGNRLPNVPLNAANLWVKYDADGALTGLSLGAGLNIVGVREGDVENTFQLPAYTLVNAMIMYQIQPAAVPWVKRLTAQLNVKNLLDTTWYEAAVNRLTIYPGTPRTILVSLRAEF